MPKMPRILCTVQLPHMRARARLEEVGGMILLGAQHCSGTAATPPVSYFFFATGSWTAKEKRARLTGGGALEKKALKEGMTHALRFSVFLLWIGYALLQSICNAALSEPDATRQQTMVWFAHYLLTSLELNFEVKTAMSFRGLLATYAIPSISSVLVTTGGFQRNVKKRYADMELLIREFNENCCNPPGGITGCHFKSFLKIASLCDTEHGHERFMKAIMRLNAIHNHYGSLISNEDMLYVLAIFATMGSLFCNSRWFSVRSFSKAENEIAFLHWMHIGRLMGIKADAANWKCFRDVLHFKNDYEAKYRKFSDSNFTVASKTIFFFSGAFPAWTRFFILPASLHVVSAMQGERESSAALGLPKPNRALTAFVYFFLILRALFFRYLIPPMPLFFSERACPTTGQLVSGNFEYFPKKLGFGNDTYSRLKGYRIETMGPASVHPSVLTKQPIYSGIPFRP